MGTATSFSRLIPIDVMERGEASGWHRKGITSVLYTQEMPGPAGGVLWDDATEGCHHLLVSGFLVFSDSRRKTNCGLQTLQNQEGNWRPWLEKTSSGRPWSWKTWEETASTVSLFEGSFNNSTTTRHELISLQCQFLQLLRQCFGPSWITSALTHAEAFPGWPVPGEKHLLGLGPSCADCIVTTDVVGPNQKRSLANLSSPENKRFNLKGSKCQNPGNSFQQTKQAENR